MPLRLSGLAMSLTREVASKGARAMQKHETAGNDLLFVSSTSAESQHATRVASMDRSFAIIGRALQARRERQLTESDSAAEAP